MTAVWYKPLLLIQIGRAIAYLASDDAVFVTGAALAIDGGTTIGHP